MPQAAQGLKTRDVMKRLDVTHVTLLNFRKGSRRRRPLPVTRLRYGRAYRVTYYESDILEWLHAYRPDLVKRWETLAKLSWRLAH